jgi:hypothetical protein
VLAIALAFANALDNGFHMDGLVRIQSNAEIRRVRPVGRHFGDPATLTSFSQLRAFRPLVPLTLSIDVAVSGESPASFRRTNLLPFGLGEALAFVGRPHEGLPYLENAVSQAPTLLESRLEAVHAQLNGP